MHSRLGALVVARSLQCVCGIEHRPERRSDWCYVALASSGLVPRATQATKQGRPERSTVLEAVEQGSALVARACVFAPVRLEQPH